MHRRLVSTEARSAVGDGQAQGLRLLTIAGPAVVRGGSEFCDPSAWHGWGGVPALPLERALCGSALASRLILPSPGTLIHPPPTWHTLSERTHTPCTTFSSSLSPSFNTRLRLASAHNRFGSRVSQSFNERYGRRGTEPDASASFLPAGGLAAAYGVHAEPRQDFSLAGLRRGLCALCTLCYTPPHIATSVAASHALQPRSSLFPSSLHRALCPSGLSVGDTLTRQTAPFC